ncbi:hypothetical protein [Schaalia sp. ZJ1691]|nr:hypothetical protein [Schaalia sp. ZJ1691]
MKFQMLVHSEDDYTIVIGPRRDGQLIEVGMREAVVFHAMKARRKFFREK